MRNSALLVALLPILLTSARPAVPAPIDPPAALPQAAQPSPDETAIRRILDEQIAAWNKGNLDDFMKGYWHSDSLTFIGQSGITYGYNAALDNYKKHYDSPDKMGQLIFQLLKLQRLSPEYYFVVGKWNLKRKAGDVGGVYTLLFRKIGGRWWIVSDHSS